MMLATLSVVAIQNWSCETSAPMRYVVSAETSLVTPEADEVASLCQYESESRPQIAMKPIATAQIWLPARKAMA